MKTLNWVKILFIALSLILAFSLVACVSETPVETDSESEESIDNGEGSVADTDKTPAESGSESTPDEETSSETEAAPACTHAECTETAAKAATCTEAGNDAYKICNACEAIIDANGNVISAIPTIAALGHTEVVDAGTPADCENAGLTDGKHCSVCNEVLVAQTAIDALGHTTDTVAAVAPTCTKEGNEAYSACSVCGKLWDSDNEEIDEIPTLAVDPDAHKVIEKSYVAPTTAEDGWEAHKACEDCGKAWAINGTELDAVPTIAKLEPDINTYIGVAELKDKQVNGVQGSLFAVPAASEDRTYVRFARAGESGDGWISLLDNNQTETGKYFVMKYRTDHSTAVQFWANTEANGHDGGKASTYFATIDDGEWRIIIVDLSVKLPNYIKENDGKYTIVWSRIDILDPAASEGYFDIAYIAFCDDVTDVSNILQDGDEKACGHLASTEPTFTNCGENHSTECIVCGSDIFYDHSIAGVPTWNSSAKKYTGSCACGYVVESDMLFVSEAYANGTTGCGRAKATRDDEAGVTRYTITGSGDVYFHIYADGTAVTGKYAVIKYRVSNGGVDAKFGNTFCGSVMDTAHGMAADSNDQNSGGLGTAYADGEWRYVIYTANSKHFIANEDGTYSYKFLRLGMTEMAADGSAYIEIDNIAFADNLEAIENYLCSIEGQELFTVNLDKTNCEISGEVLTEGGRFSDTPIVIDASDKTLATANGIVLGGWCVTPGGIASYKFRVTGVNGEAVEAPVLKDWIPGVTLNADNGVTKVGIGRGWSDACGKGSGFQSKNPIDLSEYAGNTVNVEIVIITNYGAEITVIQINNVSVPAAE